MAKWELIKEQLPNVEEMARNGNTETEIIEYLKIGRKTFYKYKKEHPELQEALNEGYRTSLRAVEAAQYKLAIGGYTYEEIVKERDKNGDLVITRIITKEAQPNGKAIENILKNKYPSKWNVADRVDVAAEITNNSIDFTKYTKEDLLDLLGGDPDE